MASRNQPFRWITAAQPPFHLTQGVCLQGRKQIGTHHAQQMLLSLVLIAESLWTLWCIFLQDDLQEEHLFCPLSQLSQSSPPPRALWQATKQANLSHAAHRCNHRDTSISAQVEQPDCHHWTLVAKKGKRRFHGWFTIWKWKISSDTSTETQRG